MRVSDCIKRDLEKKNYKSGRDLSETAIPSKYGKLSLILMYITYKINNLSIVINPNYILLLFSKYQTIAKKSQHKNSGNWLKVFFAEN